MMAHPPKTKGTDEICSMCNRPKKNHTSEEMTACSRKMKEFQDAKDGGAGIQ